MANRITHTNNSSGHDGTYVYRSTATMDPQALPAPIADEAPVASGATFEYIDSEALADGTYYYRTQDHQGGQVSAVSDEASIVVGDDYSAAQVGDEIGGGIYAGTITYADARQFHLVFAKQAGEGSGLQWGNYNLTTGATDPDDGLANQTEILTNYDDGSADAFYHCRDYANGGHADWYLPARNEAAKIDALVAASHPEFSTDLNSYVWTSTEADALGAYGRRYSDGLEVTTNKNNSDAYFRRVRPVRRIPA